MPMKKLLLAMAVGLLSVHTADASTIYAYQAWQPGVNAPVRGPICFDADDPLDVKLISDCSNEGVVYGGYYIDYHWIGQVIKQGTQSSVDGLYDIDLKTGERKLIAQGGSKMIDLTYDYANKRVLGIRTGNSWLASLNPETGESTLIGRFSIANSWGYNEIYMLAIACDLDGTLYGIASNDVFYRINPKDATLTYIAELGVDAGFDQTMAFDYNDGTLYWYNNADYTLYTIDVETGIPNTLGTVGYEGPASLGSMFIPYINVAKGAPDRVYDISTTSTDNSITLRWTNPTTTAQGESLGSLTHVIIERDGVEVAKVSTGIAPGAQSSYTDLTVESMKTHSYRIIPCNEAGKGGADLYPILAQAGSQLPGAPENLQARQGDGSAILTWETPTKGIHGGLFDPSAITGYDIYRNSVKVGSTTACEYEDKAPFGTYSYKVVTMTADGSGGEADIERFTVKPATWIVMHNGPETVKEGVKYKFYDDGGPDANYSNSQNSFLSLEPEKEGSYVCVDFTSFAVENPYDYLVVENGTGYYHPEIGKFSGTAVTSAMRHIESTATNGGLIIYFQSDAMGNMAGWEATIYTAKRSDYDPAITSFSAPALITAGHAAEAMVTVQNKGKNEVSSFTVQLIANETVVAQTNGSRLASGASASYKLSYTIDAPGTIDLVAKVILDVDGDLSNNVSLPIKQTVLDASTVFVDVAHENSEELYTVPASFTSRESICQTIVHKDNLADAKGLLLKGISFKLHTVTNVYNDVPFRLWIGETTLDNLETGIIPANQLTEVYAGKIDIADGDTDITFMLDNPIVYNGDNLVYTLHKEDSAAKNWGVTFKGCYGSDCTHKGITRFDWHWSENDGRVIDPNVTFGYSADNHRADCQFIFTADKGGVEDITVDEDNAVYVTSKGICVTGTASIYNTAGQLIASARDGDTVNVAKGIYIVKTGNKTHKVIVR